VLKTLVPEAVPPFSLEDAFTEGDAGSGKLEWVSGWRKLPHISKDMQQKFDYPQQFAARIFARIEDALRTGGRGQTGLASPTGRIFIEPAGGHPDAIAAAVTPLPVQYVLSSDVQVVAGYRARSCDEASLLHDRYEGEFAVSYQTSGGWIGISKD